MGALGLGAPDVRLSPNSGAMADIAGGRRRAMNGPHRYVGSLQLLASEKVASWRSLPQIRLPARWGFMRKYSLRSLKYRSIAALAQSLDSIVDDCPSHTTENRLDHIQELGTGGERRYFHSCGARHMSPDIIGRDPF